MASTGIDFSTLTAPNGAIRELAKLIFFKTIQGERIDGITNVQVSVVHGDKVAGIRRMGMVGTPVTGCARTFNNSMASIEEHTWDLGAWEINEGICYLDLESTLLKEYFKSGNDIADITSTEYMDKIIVPLLEQAINDLLFRLIWFGDKAATNIINKDGVISGGDITIGIDPKFVKTTDGFFKRLNTWAAANPTKVVSIGANKEATYALQENKLFEDGVAIDIFDQILRKASPELKADPNRVVICTDSLVTALEADIRRQQGICDLKWETIFAGIELGQYQGVKILRLIEWDTNIHALHDTGANYVNPHRAVYTTIDNLMVGTASANMVNSVDYWFEKKDRMNYITAQDTLGTILFDKNLVVYAK